MTVAMDLRAMQDRPWGGVGRQLAHVVPLVAAEMRVVALLDAGRPVPDLPPQVVAHPLRTPPPGLASGWLQLSAPRWLRTFDGAFHCPWYALPYALPVPGVVTLHDLTFEHRPAWMGRAMNGAYRAQARHAARVARAVLTPSEHVRRDVVATYGVDPARVLVAPHGVDPRFTPDAPRPDGLPDRYVVALAGAPRRNLPLAVAAWRRAGIDQPLVVVGEAGPMPAGVHGLGRLDDDAWAGVLAHADAFLYPTAYEGFGMPALESAASGTVVVCAAAGALPEVLGDAAAWATGLTPAALAAALRRGLGDEAVRAAGLHRARQASWEPAVRAHLAAYRLAGCL